MQREVDREHGDHEDGRDPEDQPAERPDAALEVVLRRPLREVTGDLAVARPGAGRRDHGPAGAAHDARPEEAPGRRGRPGRTRAPSAGGSPGRAAASSATAPIRRSATPRRCTGGRPRRAGRRPARCRRRPASRGRRGRRRGSAARLRLRRRARTVACSVSRAWSAATAVSDRASWTNPSAALIATIARMIPAVTSSPDDEADQARRDEDQHERARDLRDAGCARSVRRPLPPITFGPSCRRRSAASVRSVPRGSGQRRGSTSRSSRPVAAAPKRVMTSPLARVERSRQPALAGPELFLERDRIGEPVPLDDRLTRGHRGGQLAGGPIDPLDEAAVGVVAGASPVLGRGVDAGRDDRRVEVGEQRPDRVLDRERVAGRPAGRARSAPACRRSRRARRGRRTA